MNRQIMEPGMPLAETLHEHVRALARRQPEADAVFGQGLHWRWGDLARHIESAAAMLESSGVRGGERVAIVSENSPSTLVLLLAAQSVRAIPVVVNARLPRSEIDGLLACAEPSRLLFSVAGSEAAERLADDYGAGAWPVDGLEPLRGLRREAAIAPRPPSAIPGDEIATLIFTSGTTGRSKAAMLAHAGLLNQGRLVGKGRGTKPDDVINLASPLSHVMGWSTVLTALLYGASLRIMPRLAPAELVAAIARGEVQQASMVPVGWLRLVEAVEQDGVDLSRSVLRTMVAGGAPLDPELKARVERTFGAPLQNAYGMTEVAPFARQDIGRPAQPWSVGRAVEGLEVRIVDSGERDVPHGEVGEIQARGLSVMRGYFANPEATAEVMREGGWYATGDLGRWLPDGDLAVVGRRKEMIIRSGFNVYPAEVEAALATHPMVSCAAVVGEPAGHGDESIVAYVQLRNPGAASQDVRAGIAAHLKGLLAPYKCPSVIEIVDQMPLGSTGKILKRELRRNR